MASSSVSRSRKELQVDSSKTVNVKKFCLEVRCPAMRIFMTVFLLPFQRIYWHCWGYPFIWILQQQCPSVGNACGFNTKNYEAKDLPALWEKLLTDIKCSHVASEPLFMEIVNEVLWETDWSNVYSWTWGIYSSHNWSIEKGWRKYIAVCMLICRDETAVSIQWTGLLDWITGLDYWTHHIIVRACVRAEGDGKPFYPSWKRLFIWRTI